MPRLSVRLHVLFHTDAHYVSIFQLRFTSDEVVEGVFISLTW